MTIVSQTSIEQFTTPKIFQTKINWTLQNCRTLFCLDEKTFKSCNFSLTESSQICSLSLVVQEKEACANEANLSIKLDPCTQASLNLIITASIVLKNGAKSETMTKIHKIQETVKNVDLIKLNTDIMNTCLANDELSFFCEIQDVREIESDKIDKPTGKNLSMVKNFDKFYQKQQFCDVTFVIGIEEIRAHSLVLMGISSYFLAMFSHDNMIENTDRVVDLTNDSDITYEIFKGFLDYVYGCKKIAELEHIKFPLLIIADKYNIAELQKACETMICDTINHENVASILLFSSKYNCNILKKRALTFAKACYKEIVSSKEFPELSKDKTLMLELF